MKPRENENGTFFVFYNSLIVYEFLFSTFELEI